MVQSIGGQHDRAVGIPGRDDHVLHKNLEQPERKHAQQPGLPAGDSAGDRVPDAPGDAADERAGLRLRDGLGRHGAHARGAVQVVALGRHRLAGLRHCAPALSQFRGQGGGHH